MATPRGSSGSPLYTWKLNTITPVSSAPGTAIPRFANSSPPSPLENITLIPVPAAISKATQKLYGKSGAVTELKEFPDRGHSLALDSGWRDVADAALAWLKEHSL